MHINANYFTLNQIKKRYLMCILKAGTSRVIISPPVGIYLVGMERSENSHGLHDDLYATALALRSSKTEIVILTADILLFTPEIVNLVRKSASQIIGIPEKNIMLCASHCHSGPAPTADMYRPAIEQAYTTNLPYLLIGAIRMAHNNLAPAKIGFGNGSVRIGINRRRTRSDGVTVIDANPEGPIDEQVSVIRIDTLDDQPLAVLVNYACHSVVLGNGSNVISRDWPGIMYDTVEKITGAKCLFLQGAAGDINPLPGLPSDSLDVMKALGEKIGGEVISVWAGINFGVEENLDVISKNITIPLEPISKYAGKLPQLAEWDSQAGDLTLEDFKSWLFNMGSRPQKTIGDGDDVSVVAEMQAILIGDIVIVSFAAELFVKIGLQIKDRSDIKNTIVASYTNGSIGYIPLPEEYIKGGYEITEAFYGYGLPAPIAPQAAQKIVDEALNLIQGFVK